MSLYILYHSFKCNLNTNLTWNLQGRRRRGRPKNTWRRDLEADCREMGYNWSQVERLAQDRTRWHAAVDAPSGRIGISK